MADGEVGASAWADFVQRDNLFENAVRLRYFIWTIAACADPGARLLETGCGSGATSVLLSDLGYQVTAVDIDEAVVAGVRDRYDAWVRDGRLSVEQIDMLALPWRSREFSIAFHQGVLEHFPDEMIVAALREQARVADRVVFDVPNAKYGERPFGDERLLPVRKWRSMIAEAGLTVERVVGRGFPRWCYMLPYGVFARWGVLRVPGLLARMGHVSIFVCRSPIKAS